MRTARVVIMPYDTAWKSAFEEIKKEIESAVGALIVGIEHVGSTSVEGLSAKPCIDIDVIIKDYSVFDSVVKKLETIGYIHEGDLGIKSVSAQKLVHGNLGSHIPPGKPMSHKKRCVNHGGDSGD